MLVFFIHGVATHDVKYADQLKNLIKEEFIQREKHLPNFYSSFWGDVLRDVGRMWNCIHQDLQEAKQEYTQIDIDNIFRYRKFREGFLSEFVGDFFSCFNPGRGTTIRRLIAEQLHDFLEHNPEETELHIVAHSLGSAILWDVLFSERFSPQDPAFDIRAMINGFSESGRMRKIALKSITTMGSPILFLNIMLEISPEKLKQFANSYKKEPLRWINIIHSSDVVAYPLRSSLNINLSDTLFLRDEYISTDANLAEKAARSVGQVDAAMAIGGADAHIGYWQCQQVARLVSDNLLGLDTPMIQKVIARLQKVPGMTTDLMQLSRRTFIDNTLAELKFRDGSGMLRFCANPLKIHNVYILNGDNNFEFVGYVVWVHIDALTKKVELMKTSFC